jgi:hypothetical protein
MLQPHDNVFNSIVRFFQQIPNLSFKTSQNKKYFCPRLFKMAHFLDLLAENQNLCRDRKRSLWRNEAKQKTVPY